MVFSYLPFSFPLRGQRFIGNGNTSWNLPFNPYRGACCVSLDLYPNPVSLVIFWKQVYTSSVVLLNLSRKLYCNCKSLEGEDCCLFVCVFKGLVSWEALCQGGFYLDWREEKTASREFAVSVQPANPAAADVVFRGHRWPLRCLQPPACLCLCMASVVPFVGFLFSTEIHS